MAQMATICRSWTSLTLFQRQLISLVAYESRTLPCCLNRLSDMQYIQTRSSSSFFTRISAEKLWKGVTSVSAAGARRGRGRGAGRRIAKDLNKGQFLGTGEVNMVWPGLNSPVIRGREIVQQRKLPADKNYLANLLQVRNEMDIFKKKDVHPLERGWSGNYAKGRRIGPPEVGDEGKLAGFETVVLMTKAINKMTAMRGRTRQIKVMCATGNYNGLCGVGVLMCKDMRAGIRRAKNLAARRLIYFQRGGEENNTIVHDFVSQYGETKVIAVKKPKGFGIVAHRLIRELCRLIGITDIYCKVVGSTNNYLYLYRAFILGLVQQRTFQQMADEKKLHVVELRAENDYYPKVMASPSDGFVRTADHIDSDEILDFRQFLNNGKVIEIRPKKYPINERNQIFIKFLRSKWFIERNRQDVRVHLKAKYGQLDSFLTVREKKERAERRMLAAKNSPPEEKEEEEAQIQ